WHLLIGYADKRFGRMTRIRQRLEALSAFGVKPCESECELVKK
ncbi:hypothetical protein OBE_02763, partial [human gut metagenome]